MEQFASGKRELPLTNGFLQRVTGGGGGFGGLDSTFPLYTFSLHSFFSFQLSVHECSRFNPAIELS